MKKVVSLLLVLVLLVGVTACDKDKDKTEEYSSLYGYATNRLVDRFAEDYSKADVLAMENMSPIAGGKNITATISGVETTVFTDGEHLYFSLIAGMTEQSRDQMLAACCDLIRVADPTVTQADLDKTVAHLKQQKKLIMAYKVGGATKVETYSPAMTSGDVSAEYRITFYVRDYGLTIQD